MEGDFLKTLLITGGAGFIGSNFLHKIAKEYPDYFIINLDKLTYAGNLENLKELDSFGNYLFIKGDIADDKLVRNIFHGAMHQSNSPKKCIDFVVNFAAESHVDRSIQSASEFIKTNINGTNNLLLAAKNSWQGLKNDNDKRFIHISTDEVYGSLGKTGKFTEETRYNPQNPYAASKAGADHLVRSYYNTFDFPAIITNCSNNYGPYQFPEKLVPLTINNALTGKPIPVYGKGENVRDWVYVNDHCRALDLVLHYGQPGQSYNIGGDSENKNIEVVTTICEILDKLKPASKSYKELITFVQDRPGHDMRYAIDYTKINKDLGWVPEVSFSEGIRRTVQWYLDNQHWVKSVINGEYLEYYEKQYGSRKIEQ